MTAKLILLSSCFYFCACSNPSSPAKENTITADTIPSSHLPAISYAQLKANIEAKRKEFSALYKSSPDKEKIIDKAKDFWITSISNDLYEQWEGTPWDFNGTTRVPKEGMIACGYFVTTLLLDMGYQLNRIKLSTCAAMTMMKALTPGQQIQNLSYLTYEDFDKKIHDAGKGVFVIGLDFHTGLLVNDGTNTWFIHSNYIQRKSVTKEKISESATLKASHSRFVTSLTGDNGLLSRWLVD